MNETGRKTFFWYRVYLAVLALIYLAVVIFGVALLVYQPATRKYEPEDLTVMAIIYIVVGAILFFIFAVALLLPPKPYNWIVGIVLMAIGMSSCCFLPFLVPLFIFWLKPETKAFFGRN